MEILETINKGGYIAKLYEIENLWNPFSDNEYYKDFKFYAEHKGYDFGNVNKFEPVHANSWAEHIAEYFLAEYMYDDTDLYELSELQYTNLVQKALKWINKNVVLKMVSIYEHSGISLNTVNFGTNFKSGFDSGILGFVYVLKTDYKRILGYKRFTKSLFIEAQKDLDRLIKELNAYNNCEAYSFSIEHEQTGVLIDVDDSFYIDYSETQKEMLNILASKMHCSK